MKTAEEFLKEKGLTGNALCSDGVIRLMEEYASQFRQPEAVKSVCSCKICGEPVDDIYCYNCR